MENPIVDKIRNILARAADTEHEGERDTALDLATKLATKHQIDLHNLGDAGQYSERNICLHRLGNVASGIGPLISSLGEIHQVFPVHMTGGPADPRRTYEIKAYGNPTSCELFDISLRFLVNQLIIDANRDKPKSRVSYAIGWSYAVTRRLEEVQAVEYAESGTALVPTTDVLRGKVEADHPSITTGRPVEVTSGMDSVTGASAGELADIGTPKLEQR